MIEDLINVQTYLEYEEITEEKEHEILEFAKRMEDLAQSLGTDPLSVIKSEIYKVYELCSEFNIAPPYVPKGEPYYAYLHVKTEKAIDVIMRMNRLHYSLLDTERDEDNGTIQLNFASVYDPDDLPADVKEKLEHTWWDQLAEFRLKTQKHKGRNE